MVYLFNVLCEECNIGANNLEEIMLNYGRSGRSIYITTDLIYSNAEGTVTSSTLISMLWSWLLAEDSPNITLAGYSVAVSKECPIPANSFSNEVCKDHLRSFDEATANQNILSSKYIIVLAIASVAIGILIGTIGAALLHFWYVISNF